VQARELERGTLVLLTWLDSVSCHGWKYDPHHNYQPPRIQSIGFVAAATEEFVTISTSFSPSNEGMLDPLVIPWGSIVELEEVVATPCSTSSEMCTEKSPTTCLSS